MKKDIKIVQVKISELKPASYNPRKLSQSQYNQIKKSLTEFGFVDPVIVNENIDRKNTIIGGHQRVKVWADMGNDTIPAVYIDLNEKKERELNIRLNKNTGEWDIEKLLDEFDKTDLLEFGFEDDELAEFSQNLIPEEAIEDNYEIPDEIKTDIVTGDLIEIGQHRLLCGDSTKIDDVDKLLNNQRIDLVITDPPYGWK